MSGVGDLLELVFATPDPTVSVHAVVREECDRDVARQVRDRFMKTEGKPTVPKGVWLLAAPVFALGAVDWAVDKVRRQPRRPQPERVSELTVWLAPSGRARLERAWEGLDGHHRLTTLASLDDTFSDGGMPRFWPVRLDKEAVHWPTPNANDVDRLFSRKLLRQILAALDLDVIGEDEVAGRPVVAVRAVRRRSEPSLWPHWLPFGADDYELRFDRQFAHLLAIQGRADGNVYEEILVTEITYGAPID
jgi:hypothetical protein